MVSVLIKPEKKFGVDPEKIRRITSEILGKQKLGREVEVSVSLVTSSQIQKLNQKYRHLDQPTTVLTFSQQTPEPEQVRYGARGRAFRFPDEILRLGDIVICPEIAREQNLTVPFLLQHGIQNLLSQIPTAKNLRA